MLKSIAAAFSMYSAIPMPYIEWDEKTMRYAFCYFPLVGAVIGLCEYLAFILLDMASVGMMLKACVAAVLPVIISGGIHIDGFMDTSDALGSHADREKKLEIMKDPHIGAFAVIALAVYMMLYVGLFSEMRRSELFVYACGFFMSRALSGFFLMAWPKAKKDGLAVMWSSMTDKTAAYILFAEYIICSLIMIVFGGNAGITAFILTLCASAVHYFICKKVFGGISGDIAGFFLQITEFAVLLGCVIGGRL